jgi:rod shape-determining protein MreC
MENVELQAQLRDILWQKSELDALRAENRRLVQALGIKAPPGYVPLWADVMERDPLHWYNSVMVTAGSDHGVTINAPVFGERDGVLVAIGRVTEVRRDAALVLLITDELSSVAAYLSTSSVEGLIQGQGGPRLRMNYLPAEVVLSTGDLVYTSPTSATFPGEVLLGQVTAVNPRDPFLAFQSVEVRPAADAATLNHVMILLAAGRGAGAAALPFAPAAGPVTGKAAPDVRAVSASSPMKVRKSTGTAEAR